MTLKNLYKEHYTYLDPLGVINTDDQLYQDLVKIFCKLKGNIYSFPFSTDGTINAMLYKTEKIKAIDFLKTKVLEMKSEFAYIDLYTEERSSFIYVNLNKLKNHIDEFLTDCAENNLINIFNETEFAMLKRGEYEWEIIAS